MTLMHHKAGTREGDGDLETNNGHNDREAVMLLNLSTRESKQRLHDLSFLESELESTVVNCSFHA